MCDLGYSDKVVCIFCHIIRHLYECKISSEHISQILISIDCFQVSKYIFFMTSYTKFLSLDNLHLISKIGTMLVSL
jgi:hypothetical protein